jgi:hypothetical protein
MENLEVDTVPAESVKNFIKAGGLHFVRLKTGYGRSKVFEELPDTIIYSAIALGYVSIGTSHPSTVRVMTGDR